MDNTCTNSPYIKVRVMGKYKNTRLEAAILWAILSIVSLLNLMLILNIGES